METQALVNGGQIMILCIGVRFGNSRGEDLHNFGFDSCEIPYAIDLGPRRQLRSGFRFISHAYVTVFKNV